MTSNIIKLLFIPAIVAGLFGFVFYNLFDLSALYTHDVYESHVHAGQIPFICLISFFAAYLPCFALISKLMVATQNAPEPTPEICAALEVLSTPAPALHVGQVITSIGANCQLRVKEIKKALFIDADFTPYEYALNFSL